MNDVLVLKHSRNVSLMPLMSTCCLLFSETIGMARKVNR